MEQKSQFKVTVKVKVKVTVTVKSHSSQSKVSKNGAKYHYFEADLGRGRLTFWPTRQAKKVEIPIFPQELGLC